MTSLKARPLFVTGASRGIGLAVALKAAQDGANIAIAAKTTTPQAAVDATLHRLAGINWPQIMAYAAHLILTKSASYNGNFLIEDDILRPWHDRFRSLQKCSFC